MIKITKVFSPETSKAIGVGITVNNEKYFIALDQKLFPGIRGGEFPRHVEDSIFLKSYPEEEVFRIE